MVEVGQVAALGNNDVKRYAPQSNTSLANVGTLSDPPLMEQRPPLSFAGLGSVDLPILMRTGPPDILSGRHPPK